MSQSQPLQRDTAIPTTPETRDDISMSFYFTPGETWDVMYNDCQGAQKSIEFEQYIVNNDNVGNRFVQLFLDKAKQGVKVRLLLDKVGSLNLVGDPKIEEIRKHGGEVHFYNPIGWFHIFAPWTWFPRNHIKTMLIDSKTAFTGGVCLAEYMQNWRDMQVRFTGALVEDVEHHFAYLWDRMVQRKRRLRYTQAPLRKLFRYVVHKPRYRTNPIYQELLAQIGTAKHSVCLACPYFLPPRRLRAAMRMAVKRGVAVKIISSEKTDVPIIDAVSRSYFRHMLRYGWQMFLYRNTVMHAKYAIVDNVWATIGSTNMDYLSLLKNREANIITQHPDIIAKLQSHFDADLAQCIKVDISYCNAIPWKQRIIGYIGRVIRRIM